ncbi:gluconolaconase [Streptomyces sp. GMY02]|uniref:L-dopachrome tautomerase-related protein n=1 Tax=Streptomyces sp. GMY02 TaxID=1333528 RepID=UPI001C2B780F|nr:L-dopachrome tautomerase-related protein [Streptomyces sp. GMY02]QXE38365.1 gluconolaconase [Streptomyces sp. GMY02]
MRNSDAQTGGSPAIPSRRAVVALPAAMGLSLAIGSPRAVAVPRGPAAARRGPALQPVAAFYGAMPTGVTISRSGRIFVNFPHWGDEVPFSVAEIIEGKAVAYPNRQINEADPADPARHFLGVQSVVVDAAERLWVVDTGRIVWADAPYGGPKLVAIDLATNKVVRTIVLPRDVAGPHSFVNDVRFDLSRGYAYLTDATPDRPTGLIVVRLADGASWRCLDDTPFTLPAPDFVPVIDGRPFLNKPGAAPGTPVGIGADGIALSPDGTWLYFCPLSSRKLYAVRTSDLIACREGRNRSEPPVRDLGTKGMSDGLEMDRAGRVYGGDIEHNAIVRRDLDGVFRTVVQDDRLIWPDTLSIGYDQNLYVIANQLNRQAAYNSGHDLRRKPYFLFRVHIGIGPARR